MDSAFPSLAISIDQHINERNRKNSTQGGYTAKGSGTAPHWDNSTGSWSYNKYPSYLDPPETLSYTGGAAVPYLSGKVSPNGVSPRKFTNLPYTPDLEEYPSGYECTIPNTNYAYKYEAEFKYTESDDDDTSRNAPIYCCCALDSLCGCDDFHQNSSFVLAMLKREMDSPNPLNSTSVCAIDIEGETTILVSGTLEDGSTKADGETESLTETISTTGMTRCMRATGAPDEVSTGTRALGGPSQRAFILAWVGTVGAGVLVGMGVVLL